MNELGGSVVFRRDKFAEGDSPYTTGTGGDYDWVPG
jgi:hypothetical protein